MLRVLSLYCVETFPQNIMALEDEKMQRIAVNSVAVAHIVYIATSSGGFGGPGVEELIVNHVDVKYK